MLSSVQDPFEVARDEVQAAVQKVKFMHKEWRRLLETENTCESHRFQDLHAELVGELQQLDYDLQEVARSITTVEENREHFKLSNEQLAARKRFVAESREAHKVAHDELGSRRTAAKMEDDRKKSMMSKRNQQEQAQQRQQEQQEDEFVRDQHTLQKQLIQNQEDELSTLQKTTEMLGVTAQTINGELESQQKMLDELNLDVELESDRMNEIMKGAGAVLKTNNKWQISGIIGLILLFIILLNLFIFT